MEKKTEDPALTRRQLLIRSAKAGTTLTLTGAVSFALYDSSDPGNRKSSAKTTLPDYSVPAVTGRTLAIIRGQSRKETLRKALKSLGGIERFIKKGDRVVLKPNVAFASAPRLGATSHPDIVFEMTRLCLKAGAASVTVMDNPINDPASCFLLSGIGEAARKAGGSVIVPAERSFSTFTLKKGRLIKDWPLLYDPLQKATKLIGLAPVKSHSRSGASMTMKNWYGLLGGRRNIFHQDIHTIITELAMLIKPTLVVLDGFDVMMTNGPTGGSLSDLKQMNTIIAGTDQVAVDTVGAGLLGMTPSKLPFLGGAEKAGVGTVNIDSLKPVKINGGSAT